MTAINRAFAAVQKYTVKDYISNIKLEKGDHYYPYETSSAAAALQNGFKKRYKRAVKALGCSSCKFWLQWKAL